MRALLDVNVLIALLDQDHTLHAAALGWFGARAATGWASCPLTQNGCIRVMSHVSYPNALPAAQVCVRLRDAVANPAHEFWPDDISLLDGNVADPTRIIGSRHVTDVYLLGLAVRHGGTFATFDRTIPTNAVRGFRKAHLTML